MPGTGANAGQPMNITAQAGQQQSGVNVNNNGGPLNLSSGAAGTGGSSTAGIDGPVNFFCGSTQVGFFTDNVTVALAIGPTPATAGAGIRLTNNAGIAMRNAANSGNYFLVTTALGSDQIIVGDSNASNLLFRIPTTGTFEFQAAGVSYYGLSGKDPYVFAFFAAATNPTITQAIQLTDVPVPLMTFRAGAADVNATTNITGGNLLVEGGVGATGNATFIGGSVAINGLPGNVPANSGQVVLQNTATTIFGVDANGPFFGQSPAISVAAANVTLSGADMLSGYFNLTGTVATPSCTITLPSGLPTGGAAREWRVDISQVTLGANSIIFTVGTGATTATITAATAISKVLLLFQPTANTLYLLGI
jgi:hypothetical protein